MSLPQVCPVDLILFFDVANETLKKRLLGRAAVSQRADDNEETINKRIEIFNAKNNEIVEYYQTKVVRVSFRPKIGLPRGSFDFRYIFFAHILVFTKKIIVSFQINAEGTVEEIFGEVTKALDGLLADV